MTDLEVLENACYVVIASVIKGMCEKLGNSPERRNERSRGDVLYNVISIKPLNDAIQSLTTPSPCLARLFSPRLESGADPQRNPYRLAARSSRAGHISSCCPAD
jgi:hypothetical protein